MSEALLGHSPLGASGASRWMKCPGSVTLSSGVEDEESDHAALGTAAHALAAHLLACDGDAWSMIGTAIVDGTFYPPVAAGYEAAKKQGILIDKEMADAVQVYLDWVRYKFPDRNQGNTFIERRFHCPSIHKLFYGQSDFTYLMDLVDGPDNPPMRLVVADYKHGAGIVVEAEENPQLMYYACGMLEEIGLWDYKGEIEVGLYIVQPRGWHRDGPIRKWSTTVAELKRWLKDELVPAMDHALVSNETFSGEHCRFCPARGRACPQLMKEMEEYEEMAKGLEGAKGADPLTPEQLARFMNLKARAKIVFAAAEKTAFNRLQAGAPVPGWKLAPKRANREFREGAEKEAVKTFGEEAFTKPALKSPAQIEELVGGDAFVAKYAYKPDAGLTVVPVSDARPAVSRDTKSAFAPVKKGK